MRQRLLDRLISGEIDQGSYDRMLVEIERFKEESARETPRSGARRTSWITPGAIFGSPTCLLSGYQLGKFKIEEKLGQGGMGEVWKAWDTLADRHVVIKTLPGALQASERHMARVKSSFQQIHELQHQHICPVYDLGYEEYGGYYLVMKYIAGGTLLDYRLANVDLDGNCPIEKVLRVLWPVAEALDYAHIQKVMHRDIKPENIMSRADGSDVQVVDFGLAAQIRTSMSQISRVKMEVGGTPPYMAPEQWMGRYQDGRTDEYALSVVAYQLLSGRLPFDADEFQAMYHCALNEPMPRLEQQSEGINLVLETGMAKSPDNRYPSCQHFVDALEKAA
jgi:serine/threonine-protein kinase